MNSALFAFLLVFYPRLSLIGASSQFLSLFSPFALPIALCAPRLKYLIHIAYLFYSFASIVFYLLLFHLSIFLLFSLIQNLSEEDLTYLSFCPQAHQIIQALHQHLRVVTRNLSLFVVANH